jgi:hypothetical protein
MRFSASVYNASYGHNARKNANTTEREVPIILVQYEH